MRLPNKKLTYTPRSDRDIRARSALNTLEKILNLDISDDYNPKKSSFVKNCLWGIGEKDGEQVIQYCTPAAYQRYAETQKYKDTQRDHVYPLSELVEQLMNGQISVEDIESFVVVCRVTKEEHNLIKYAQGLGWERYCSTKIDVLKYDSDKQDWVDFIKDGEFV